MNSVTVKSATKAILAASIVIAACASTQASLVDFNISYTDIEGDVGSGTVAAQYLGNGEYLAQSGSFTITSGPYAGFAGTLQSSAGHGLWAGTGPGYEYTAYGGTDLGFDNLIGVVGSTYTLSWWGMLFNDTTYPRPGGQGLVFDPSTSGGYGYNNNFGGQSYGGFNGYNNQPWFDWPPATITIDLAPVPEPTTLISGALLLLPFGASTLRILRRNRVA